MGRIDFVMKGNSLCELKRKLAYNERRRSKGYKRDTRSVAHRQLECQRLKEIIPTLADRVGISEVIVIEEAIKHITRLEEAVLHRLLSPTLEHQLPPDVQTGCGSRSLIPPTTDFIRLGHHSRRCTQVAHGNSRAPWNREQPIGQFGSTGVTPNNTTDDESQGGG